MFEPLIDDTDVFVAVISAPTADIAASSADINSTSGSASVVRPGWLAAGCGLVLDPVLAMKLVATHDGLHNVAAVPLSSAVSASSDVTSRDLSTTSSSADTATATAVTLTT